MEETEVKYLTSIALAVNDAFDEVKHVQLTIVQELESRQIRCYMDVVDPSKIKLADPDGLSESDNA